MALTQTSTMTKLIVGKEPVITSAYIMYKGERIDVTVESTFNGGSMANVKAVKGYPFLSSEVNSQGETFGAWNCNGRRVRSDSVIVEVAHSPEDYEPHPVDEAQRIERAIDSELIAESKQVVLSAVPVKATVSRSWAERHLNTDVNGFEAELDKAFGVGKWILKRGCDERNA